MEDEIITDVSIEGQQAIHLHKVISGRKFEAVDEQDEKGRKK